MAKKNTTKANAAVPTAAVTVALPALPKLPKSARKARALKQCVCGCGSTTHARYAPGHDSRIHALVLRVERGVMQLTDAAILPGQRPVIAKRIAERKASGATSPKPVVKPAEQPIQKSA